MAPVQGWRIDGLRQGSPRHHLSKAVKSLDDIKGTKIRTAGPQESAVIRLFGATPVGMGMPAVTESISRGVIGGTLQSWTGVRSFRVANVTKGHVEEPLGTLAFIIGMNRSSYEKLPKNVQAAMDKHGGLGLAKRGGSAFDETSESYSAGFKNDKSRSFIKIEGALADQRRQMFMALHEDWKTSVKDGAEKYARLMAVLKEVRAGN